jgi:hypothetical protein
MSSSGSVRVPGGNPPPAVGDTITQAGRGSSLAAILFDHLVDACKQRQRHYIIAQWLCRFEVYRYNEVVRSIFFGPAYVAVTNGYFDEVGIDLTITTAQGGDKSLAALLVGSRARAYFRRLVNTPLRYAHFQSSH